MTLCQQYKISQKQETGIFFQTSSIRSVKEQKFTACVSYVVRGDHSVHSVPVTYLHRLVTSCCYRSYKITIKQGRQLVTKNSNINTHLIITEKKVIYWNFCSFTDLIDEFWKKIPVSCFCEILYCWHNVILLKSRLVGSES
jgi:hypothetical protein